jgi:hypothetical protein
MRIVILLPRPHTPQAKSWRAHNILQRLLTGCRKNYIYFYYENDRFYEFKSGQQNFCGNSFLFDTANILYSNPLTLLIFLKNCHL